MMDKKSLEQLSSQIRECAVLAIEARRALLNEGESFAIDILKKLEEKQFSLFAKIEMQLVLGSDYLVDFSGASE